MRIKSYFAKSVNQAVAEARAEMGEDALLLNTRKAEAGYEVVFGLADDDSSAEEAVEAASDRGAENPRAIPARAPATNDPSSGELERLLAQMEEMHRLLLANARPASNAYKVPELNGVFRRLVEAGIETALAKAVVDKVEAAIATEAPALIPKRTVSIKWRTRGFDWKKLDELLRKELSARVRIDPSLGAAGSEGTVIAMVGPGGAGKTTTLMKIAAWQASPDRPVRLLTLDASGLGDRMQLQFFARKAGIAFAAVEAPEALPAMVQSARKKEIVLIDTPSGADSADCERLARALASCPGVDVHLAAPGYMTGAALRRCLGKYRAFGPAKLAITKLDESPAYGAAVSEAARSGLSISLLTNGVTIPQDLHAASLDDLVAMALPPERVRKVCA